MIAAMGSEIEANRTNGVPPAPRSLTRILSIAVLIAGMAAVGLALAAAGPGDSPLAALVATETLTPSITPTATATLRPYTGDDDATPEPGEDDPLVAREVVAPPTRTPTPTTTPTPTDTPPPTITPTFDAPEIHWSQADKNALSWLCYGEVGGMAWAKVDACLSIISTVRVRYAYGTGASDTVYEALTRPGQFNVRIETDRPSPDDELNQTVELYEQGMRGSCTGFRYFNSSPGAPGDCVIYGPLGQFVQFHHSW